MADVWDSISGGLTETIDYKPAPSNVQMYPDNSNVTILGQVWLPRIYGKNLTSFEIASSGKIAITVNDIHSMDIFSSNMNGIFTNRFAAKSNYSMEFFTQNGDTRFFLDGSNKTASLKATETVSVYASNNVLDLSSGSNVNVTASKDIVGVATDNVTLRADTGSLALTAADSNVQVFLDDLTRDFQVIAQSNVVLDAGQNVEGTASNSVAFLATTGDFTADASSNAYLHLDSNWYASLWGRSNVNVTASNSVIVVASSNVGVSAGAGTLTMNAGDSNVRVDLLSGSAGLDLYAKSNVVLTASNMGSFFAQSNLSLTASAGTLAAVAGSDLKLTSSNNTLATSLGRFDVVSTGDVALNSLSSNFGLFANASNVFVKSLDGSNLVMSASSNVSVTSAIDTTITATSGDFNVVAGSDISMSSASNAHLEADSGALYLDLNSTTSTGTLHAGVVKVTALNGALVDGGANEVTLFAENSNIAIGMSNSTIYGISVSNIQLTAGSNIVQTAATDFTLAANTGDMFFAANASNVTMTMDAATNSLSVYAQSNVTLTASNQLGVISQSNVAVTSLVGSVAVSAAADGVSVVMGTDKSLSVYSSNTVSVTSSNNIDITAVSDVSIVGQQFATLGSVAGTTINATDGDVNINGGANARIEAGTGSVKLLADDAATQVKLENNEVLLSSTGSIQASSTAVGLYAAQDLTMSADTSNVYIQMSVPEDTLSLYALSNVSVTSGQTVSVTASSNVAIGSAVNTFITASNNGLFSASNNLTLSASNTVYLRGKDLDAQFNNISWTADSNINFKILSSESPGDPVFTISSNEVRIRGNIVVTGEINTSNIVNTTVVQQTLKVSDRVIKVANDGSGSNEVGPLDGFLTNDQSGLVVDGYPTMSNVSWSNAYEKSLKWHYGDSVDSVGVLGLGSSNIEKEAYWEMTGGSFRLTHKKVDELGNITDVSFGFRVNELEELEMVKKYWSATANAYVYKRVARFGRIIL